MQDSVDCDYFRTPVKFQDPDIYRFVGDIHKKSRAKIDPAQITQTPLHRHKKIGFQDFSFSTVPSASPVGISITGMRLTVAPANNN